MKTDWESKNILLKEYFKNHDFIKNNISSFNDFIEWRIKAVVDEFTEAVPAVIPPDVEEVKFRFGEVRLGESIFIEADGAERKVFPTEARLRNLTYSAPLFLEVSIVVDGKEKEKQEVHIADIPIMVKSNHCYLKNLTPDELVSRGEDPYDPGGYFIVNGTERVIALLEDLAPNRVFVAGEKVGPSTHTAKIFSSGKSYEIPQTVERMKDGMFVITFGGLRRVPCVLLMKVLGLKTDKEIFEATGLPDISEDLYINLYDAIEFDTHAKAMEGMSKFVGVALTKEQKAQRIGYLLDNLLLPHVGTDKAARIAKAFFIGRMIKKIHMLIEEKIEPDDKDHYMNKRVRLAGDLLEDLFRTNFKVLVGDMLYIFQRGVRRGKILPLSAVIRTKLLSGRIKSAMATGNWSTNRQGVSQRLERENFLATLSHLYRVSSLLSTSQENFEARELHATHWGRLCPIESPEGKNIGLRKNLSLMSEITPKKQTQVLTETMKSLESLGLNKQFKTEVSA